MDTSPKNDALIGDWENLPLCWPEDGTANAATLTALTLSLEPIVGSGEQYIAGELGQETPVLENLATVVATGVQAAALEAALVGNLLAVLADGEAWVRPPHF